MLLIIGLGNPGREYNRTRHNIGFEVINYLSDKHRIDLNQKKHRALIGTGRIGSEKVVLVQPQTFMNLSGESVRELLNFYKLTMEDVIIIYDDISLALGKIRIRPKGSAGGHNGIKSIIAHGGTDTFMRVKVGVDEKPKGWDLADYVLAQFPKEDEPKVKEAIILAANAVETLINEDVAVAMNRFN